MKPAKPISVLLVSALVALAAATMDAAPASPSAPASDHWALQPVTRPAPPQTVNRKWARNDIDRFILARLEQEGLKPSPETDRVSWLRRVYFDLIGLPPSPEQVGAFTKDRRRDAYERVVDELLASPRYGERWAQHWLDVVRYADTHGFEVNTERPHAWPYRDYVIRAFNKDTPYDQFIREQIVGDALGEDAATGFLITASVLLPGQIGADDVSKRLARQDAIDEIVVNIGQTFLGLSVGCARCHDHKFDPISARDYYAMQAFVAGVDYEDREMRTVETESQRRADEKWKARVAEIDQSLAKFVPMARPGSGTLRVTSAKENVETFAPVTAKFVRFTIHDANLHPTLGLIEPCIDEFEIFTDEPQPRNVALASFGTKVTASGSRTSGSHKLEHINDGKYGNSRSWMADAAGRGWVQFELPEPVRIAKIVWSRDREGGFSDRLPTAYTLEAGAAAESLQTLVSVPPPRPAVNARVNTDRFAPVKAKRVRFTIRGTNNLEPCVDELEVFDTNGVNIALASKGAVATSSGNTVVADRHELRFVNDGEYGNSRSWMSSEHGGGWVALELPEERIIDRVVWGRDRKGEFTDRLATNYVIEVADVSGAWRVVADASDRALKSSGDKAGQLTLAGLSAGESREATRLMDEKKSLEGRIRASEESRLAFAGRFRTPDKIHLLHRGDPEQPKDEAVPAVLSVLGGKQLPRDSAEQERRRALADWIASAENPLTARVMVNRIWQGHFGTGLVDTPSDFGRNGGKPTHTELLDWLASEFVRAGWSVKQMHRLIVLSATYRQRSVVSEAVISKTVKKPTVTPRPNTDSLNTDSLITSFASAQQRDSDVRLLWRFPSRRLEAEAIRDSILDVSGQLNLKMYGRGFDLFNQRGGLSGFKPVESFSGDGLRRMIYAHKVRREREAVFGAFDCPDAGQSTARRRESTTPIQALNLFNSRFVIEQSEAFAARLRKEAGTDVSKQIHRAYELALNRRASATELVEVRQIVTEHGLPVLCRALFNCNEFVCVP